jgi:branched-chain amino acid transport system permease protein
MRQRSGAWSRRAARWLGPAAVLLLVLFPFLFAWISGRPVDSGPPKFWQGQLVVVFLMAVFAMSYDLLLGFVGILSFGHAAFFGGGAYAMALFLAHGAPRLAGGAAGGGEAVAGAALATVGPAAEALLLAGGFLLAVGACILLGLLFSVVSVRVKGVYFAMITLAIAVAVYILAKSTDFVQWTGADEGLHGVWIPAWLNPTRFRLRFYYVTLGFMILMYLALRRITQSPVGRVFFAIRENESRARMIGYNPAAYRTLAFVISAVTAGLSGALYAIWDRGATPSLLDVSTTIDALIMTILGGIGTLIGPILGAGIMEVFGHFFYQWFGARWPLVFGVIFIVLVLFLPQGIVGTLARARPGRGGVGGAGGGESSGASSSGGGAPPGGSAEGRRRLFGLLFGGRSEGGTP